MTVESVRKYIDEKDLDIEIMHMKTSTATVELAAESLGVEPGRIAKSMAIRLKDRDIILVVKGDVRLDNRKFKDHFKEKPRFIDGDEMLEATGHPVGGVCPFGLSKPLDIYLDQSLKVYDHVFPAAGGPSTCLRIDVDLMGKVTCGQWVDVCK